MSTVGYDRRAITLDGKRTLILSGSTHYPRSTPAMWPKLFDLSREAGLNTIETYVFWNLHERRRGQFDFTGRLDLLRFCRLAQERGLNVILRIGPYICAETNYGGFPPWLRDVPGMAMRTWNEPFLREMEHWVRLLCEYLRPMFAPNGGPIILSQLENEYGNIAARYGKAGERYLAWVVRLWRSLGVKIPMVMCMGGWRGAIETINGYCAHEQIEEKFRKHPGQPALWTEAWCGCYDEWGSRHRTRSAERCAYGLARFFAAGGSGIVYYMWHGGTNFGRESMFLQATSYDLDAPLDEYGLITTKYNHLAPIHRILRAYADVLLQSPPARPQSLGAEQKAYVYRRPGRRLAFVCNDAAEPAAVRFAGKRYDLAGESVVILGEGKVLCDTAVVPRGKTVRRRFAPLPHALSAVEYLQEPLPESRCGEPTVASPEPLEQLQLTEDRSDYCWYWAEIRVRRGGPGTLVLTRAGDMIHLFVDGRYATTLATAITESRGKIDGPGFRHEAKLSLRPGQHTVALLGCAIGLIKGDWAIEDNMAAERKGLWGPVTWNGCAVTPWRMLPGLWGERQALCGPPGASAPWRPAAARRAGGVLRWYRARFKRPPGPTPLALDLGGMNKGLAWVNGHCIGRYWLFKAKDEPMPDWIAHGAVAGAAGMPTQRYYHVPREWLRDTNELVLFEERGGDPSSIRLCRRL
jgi:beta-galactosidase